MPSASDTKPLSRRTPARSLIALQVLAPLGALAIALACGGSRWSLPALLLIGGCAIVGEIAVLETTGRMEVSASLLALVIATVVLGPAPAVLVGALAVSAGWLRFRWPIGSLVNNLANFAWTPLVGGLFLQTASHLGHTGRGSVAYYLLVFASYLASLGVNFLIAAAYRCHLDRTRLLPKVEEMLLPILPAELLTALLTVVAIYVTSQLGVEGLALLALVLATFQYLASELLKSKRRSEKLQHIATTDELTGLPNRERFRKAVEERIAGAGVAGRFAVMLMDLDRFKEVNDTLGHHYGDVLLRDLGPRLVAAVGEGGLVARLGGDEFAILPGADTDDVAEIDALVARLCDSINQPFCVDELSLEVGASIGVARYPADGRDSHALLRCADIAMYAAKEAQTDHKVYAVEQNQHSVRRLNVLSDIRHALDGEEIVVHYQPIVDVDKQAVIGAEGLVRWEHPEHGLIPPGMFVQTVEQTGLIGPLTRRVLEQAIAECARWRRGGQELWVAVNLSVRNLLDRDLPREIERLLDAHHLPADALRLEITESMIMSDPERAMATVGRLSELGVRLSVDDFGTGYSSLANLRRLPIDELKIDRSFVSPMLQDESDLIIVRSTINLGHDLGLRIIAEGVEDEQTLERLSTLGCDMAQGYHLSRPLPAERFRRWLADWNAARRTNTAVGASGTRAPANPTGPAALRPSIVLARPES